MVIPNEVVVGPVVIVADGDAALVVSEDFAEDTEVDMETELTVELGVAAAPKPGRKLGE